MSFLFRVKFVTIQTRQDYRLKRTERIQDKLKQTINIKSILTAFMS